MQKINYGKGSRGESRASQSSGWAVNSQLEAKWQNATFNPAPPKKCQKLTH